jgi:hypothetical protein
MNAVVIDPSLRRITETLVHQRDIRGIVGAELGWFTEPGAIFWHDDTGLMKHGLCTFRLLRCGIVSQPLAGRFVVTGTKHALGKIKERIKWSHEMSHDFAVTWTSGPGPIIRSNVTRKE